MDECETGYAHARRDRHRHRRLPHGFALPPEFALRVVERCVVLFWWMRDIAGRVCEQWPMCARQFAT